MANPDIDAETYLTFFLTCWLSGKVFVNASISVQSETFLMAVKMAEANNIR